MFWVHAHLCAVVPGRAWHKPYTSLNPTHTSIRGRDLAMVLAARATSQGVADVADVDARARARVERVV